MKEPLDELLVQACAAQQQTDLAALEQLAPANVPMPFGAPHTPAAAENGHYSRRLRSIGYHRVCLLAKSCRDPGGQPGIPCRAGSTAEQHPHGTNAADLAAGWLHRDMG